MTRASWRGREENEEERIGENELGRQGERKGGKSCDRYPKKSS